MTTGRRGRSASAPRVIEVLAWHPPKPGGTPGATRADWRDLALCGKAGSPDDWFPDKDTGGKPPPHVRSTCAVCPVQPECLAFAILHSVRDGWWGGMSPDERRLLPRPAPRPATRCGSGRHRRTPDNTGPSGRCLDCRRERDAERRAAERVARTGSASPQSGRTLAA